MKKFRVIVEKTSTGYSAYADEYSVFTTGKDMKELIKNAVEAFNFYFEEAGAKISVSERNLELSF